MTPNPTLWTTAPVLLGVLAAFFILAGVRQMRRARPVMGAVTLLGGAALGCLGLALAAIAVNLLSFARLTYERPVAEVRVLSLNVPEKRYTVTVTPTHAPATACVLQGDEWLLGARVQTWQRWANVLGFDATYTLDQLANKYTDAMEANGKPITACDLAGPDPALKRYVPARVTALAQRYLQLEDRRFGSAVFMPLADGAAYRIQMTQTGLAAEPANDIARAALAAR